MIGEISTSTDSDLSNVYTLTNLKDPRVMTKIIENKHDDKRLAIIMTTEEQ